MAIVESLLLRLGLDTVQAQAGLRELKGSFNELLKIGGSFAGLFSLSAMANSFIETNNKIDQLSQSLGEDYEQIQVWGEAVKIVGGNVEGLQGSLTSLNTGMQQIALSGTGSLLPVLNRLGVSVRGGEGGIKKGTELLKDLSSSFSRLTDRQALNFGKQLGLDSGTINLLKRGREEVDKVLERQRLLGVYTKEDGKIARDFSNSLDDLKQVLMSVVAVFTRMVLPILKMFNEAMINIALFVRKYENFIKVFLLTLATIFAFRLAPAIFGVVKAFLQLKGSTMWLVIISSLIAMLIDDFMIWKAGGDSLFGSFYKWFSEADGWVKILLSSVGLLVGAFAVNKVTGFGTALIGMVKTVSGVLKASPLWLLLTSATFLYNSKDIGEKAGGWIDSMVHGEYDKQFKQPISNEAIQEKLIEAKARKEARAQNNTQSNQVSIGEIKVVTQATDSQGIANNIGGAVKNNVNNLVNQNNWL